jgi:phenol 2-monooxygenase
MESDKIDVVICGSGSAGLSAAIWLARYGINFKLLERRDGPLEIGQADGVQCRTVEIFESLGISEPLLKESYHVLEIAFWTELAESAGITLERTKPDTEPGLSHQPHVILNQARINGIMIDEIRRLRNNRDDGIEYGCQVESVAMKEAENKDYPVEVVFSKNGVSSTKRAKYVIVSRPVHL